MGALDNALYDMRHGGPRRIVEASVRRFASRLPAEATVIEIGSGVYDHRPAFSSLIRLDLDPTQHPNVVADAHRLPLADASVDAAVSISVLEHVRDPYALVRDWFRVMRPGGRVMAWVPFFFGVHAFPVDVSRFTREGLVMLFEQAGFRVESADSAPYSGLFFNLSNSVHFVLPRRSQRRAVRGLNRALFMATRAGYPLDRRFGLQLRTLYAGTEIEAVRPL